WVPVTPRAEIEQWDATKSYAINEIVTDRGMIWIAKAQSPIGNQPQEPSSVWKLLGSPGLVKITSICHATDGLDSVPKVEGAQALDRSTGQVYTYLNNLWVELLGGYYGATGVQPTTAQQISFNRTDTPTWPAATTNVQAAIRLIYQQLAASAAASAPQIGEIKMFASVTIPTGWQLCDGATINPSKTAAIALIGANVPDMRSQFPRGWDAGHNPLSREGATTGAPSGGNPSATGVSLAVTGKTDQAGAHTHTNAPGTLHKSSGSPTLDVGHTNTGITGAGGVHTHNFTGTATGTVTVNTGWDTETRPANVRVVYAIYVG
ncbi:MAG: tail fiber protein, partial [Vulcanococcus sp.]